MVIYKITNKVNGKIYVGQTIGTVEGRWTKHRCDSEKKYRTLIGKAIKKYGADNFIIEPICSAICGEHLDFLENKFINFFKSLQPHGYNMIPGGGKSYLRNQSERARKKISDVQTGRKVTEKTKEKMSLSAKISKKKNGITEKQRAALLLGHKSLQNKAPWNKGKKVTNPETLKRLRDSHIGQVAKNKVKVLCIENGIIYDSIRAAAEKLNTNSPAISKMLSGARKTANGYTFKTIKK